MTFGEAWRLAPLMPVRIASLAGLVFAVSWFAFALLMRAVAVAVVAAVAVGQWSVRRFRTARAVTVGAEQ